MVINYFVEFVRPSPSINPRTSELPNSMLVGQINFMLHIINVVNFHQNRDIDRCVSKKAHIYLCLGGKQSWLHLNKL